MVQELERDRTIASEFVRFHFFEPEEGWSIADCAEFFQDLAPLCELLSVVDSWALIRRRMINNSTFESQAPWHREYFNTDISLHPLLAPPLVRLQQVHDANVRSFTFNSPISVLIQSGVRISKGAVQKILSAYKHVAHYSAMEKKLQAEAEIANQAAFKAKLENIKLAVKIHETIKDRHMQDRFAAVVNDTLLPFAGSVSPRLKSIELTDDTK